MNVRTLLVCGSVVSALLPARSETYYLITGETKQSNSIGFDNPSAWSSDGKSTGTKPEAFSADDTYVVRRDALRLRVYGDNDRTFAGGTLQLGNGGNHGALLLYTYQPYRVTIPRISLKHGCIYAAGTGKFLLDSKITVDTVKGEYTHITFNYYENMLLRLEGELNATESSVLNFGAIGGFGGGSARDNVLEVASDCSGFLGTLEVTSYVETADDVPDKTVLYDGVKTFPGKMTFTRNCALGTASPTDTLAVSDLTMDDGSFLLAQVEGGFAGLVTVTDRFSAAGTIKVVASGNATPGSRLPLLSFPATEDNAEVRFTVCDALQTAVTETVDGVTTLYIEYSEYPVVYQTRSGAVLGSSESWSDGSTANQAGVNYVLDVNALTDGGGGATLTIPAEPDETVFAGESLTIGAGCKLYYYNSRSKNTFYCRRLSLLDGSEIVGGQLTHLTVNGEKMFVPSGTVKLGVSNERVLTINPEITGNATLELGGLLLNTTSSPDGRYRFNSLNTNFQGRVVANLKHDIYVAFHRRYQIIFFSDYRNLGGDLPVFDPQAVTLTKYDRLWPEANVTIPAKSNRGVFADGNGVIHVDNAKNSVRTLRIDTGIAVNGAMYKTGAGVLELGGVTRFGEDAASTDPVEGSNLFVITGGVVRVCSAGALDGMRTTFTDTGSLELEIDMADEEMIRYGLRNVKTAVPFVPYEGSEKIPFSVSANGDAPDAQPFTIGILTVTNTAADSVRAMLPERAPKLFAKFLSEWTETADEESGTVTFSVKCFKKGAVITIR